MDSSITESSYVRGRRSAGVALLTATGALVAVAFIGIFVGSAGLSSGDVIGALAGNADSTTLFIVREVRLPSVALAALVGSLLASGGSAAQGLLRNPLADPYILGVSGGAALAVALASLGGASALLLPAAAFLGALIAVLVLNGAIESSRQGWSGSDNGVRLLLVGVVFNALASALLLVVYALAEPRELQRLIFWLMGMIDPSRIDEAWWSWLWPMALVPQLLLWTQGHTLNLLSQGEDEALARGIDTERSRKLVFFLCTAVVAVAVAFSGMIGFVGLIVPHLIRLAVGPDHRLLLPLSSLLGASFLVLCDAAARGAFTLSSQVLPVGAICALVGAPVFLWLLYRSRGGWSL